MKYLFLFVVAVSCIATATAQMRSVLRRVTIMSTFLAYKGSRADCSHQGKWEPIRRAFSTDQIEFKFALKQENVEKLHKLAMDISTPGTKLYGKHITNDDIARLVGAPESRVTKVQKWVKEHLPSSHITLSHHHDYLLVEAKIADIENAFPGLQLHQFAVPSRQKVGNLIVRSKTPVNIPESLKEDVDSIFGLSDFPFVRARRPSAQGAFPGINITPDILVPYYNISSEGSPRSPNSLQAVAEFQQEYFYPSDIVAFQKHFNLPQTPVKIIGINKPDKGYLAEAALDIEWMFTVSPNIPIWVFSFDQFDLVNWSQNVTATPDAPLVHSISYAGGESDYSTETMERVNTEFAKMAALGFSILVASGDDGTGHTGIISCGTFMPNFPATLPFVTSVGGTYLTAAQQEIAISFSSGGFSTYFEQPDYQKQAIQGYISQKGLPSSSFWNSTGRGFPDLSALSTNFYTIISNYPGYESGTSVSTPVVAGMISLINDQRVAAGKAPLGFLNPWLYQLNNIGRDIVQGNNKDEMCSAGFPALKGWDSVTGLGTPSYIVLLASAMSLP